MKKYQLAEFHPEVVRHLSFFLPTKPPSFGLFDVVIPICLCWSAQRSGCRFFFWPPKTRVPVLLLEGNVWKPSGTELEGLGWDQPQHLRNPWRNPALEMGGWRVNFWGVRQPQMEGKICRWNCFFLPRGDGPPRLQQSPNKNSFHLELQTTMLFVSMDVC